MSMKLTIAALLTSLCLTACAVGPNYLRPDTQAPDKWLSSIRKPDEKAVIDQEWWKNFNDPVLEKLTAQAVAGNFDLKIAATRIAQARANTAQARATLFPTVNADGSYLRQANRLSFPGGGGIPIDLTKPFNTYQAGFDASWELDLFGGTRRQIEAENAKLEAARDDYDAARISLMAEVARTYIDIRHDQAQLAILDDTVKADKKTVALSTELYKAGSAPHVDVTRADAELAQAQSQIPTWQSSLAASEFSLDVLLGAQPGTAGVFVAAAQPIPAVKAEPVLATPAEVIASRPDLRSAERMLAVATAQQGVATAAMLPRVSLSGFLGLLNVNAGNLLMAQSKSWSDGASILQPLFDFGRLRAGLDLVKAQKQEAFATYEKAVVTALSDVESALSAYSHAGDHRRDLSRAVDDSRRAASVAREQYKQGATTFLTVLDAQRSLYTAQSQMAEAHAQESQDLVALYKSLGGGWKAGAAESGAQGGACSSPK